MVAREFIATLRGYFNDILEKERLNVLRRYRYLGTFNAYIIGMAVLRYKVFPLFLGMKKNLRKKSH